ncbi:PIN domain-containing protein [Candidatus Pacearchaeota archaeon]|nr:PIN domain-containing protein [Candidatus Pacearchaeota archaeon]
METPETFFLDSYALIEIIKENKNFKRFEKTINFTGIMNMLEVHYSVSRDFGAKRADEIIDQIKTMKINIEIKDVKEASKFRIKNSKLRFSYIDCLGYIMAINRNFRFVTGDNQFKDFENVEFVK